VGRHAYGDLRQKSSFLDATDPVDNIMAKAERSLGLALAALVGTAAMVALTACAKPADDTRANGADASTGPSSDSGLAGVLTSPSASADPGGDTATPKPETSKTSSAPAGPSIVSFKITKQPACPDSEGPYQPETNTVVLTWKVAGGATGAALSVDNPEIVGSYRTYTGTEGSETLNFPCDGQPGATVTHKYTLRTVGGGTVKRMDLSASAKMPK